MFMRYSPAIAVLLVLSGCSSGTPFTPTPPPPYTQVGLTVTPTSVEPGQSATLNWSTQNATACTAGGATDGGAWTGSKPTAGSQNVILIAKSLTFTLTCKGSNGTPTQTVTLNEETGPNGCTVTPTVLSKTDRPMSRRRKLTHRAPSF